jgi:non-heme chloroperoxidase
MKTHVACVALLILAFTETATAATDISGTWQGKGTAQHVLKVSKTPSGGFRGDFYNLGRERAAETLNGNPISKINIAGDTVTFSLDRAVGTFNGTVSPDGKSIAAIWQATGPSESITFERATKETSWVIDPSPHTARFITVDKGVALEVLDWGGSGPPLVFLAGNGNTAHVFDTFALKFIGKHHVYGITRRGFGLSGWPLPTVANYDPDKLGDDVLAVIDALKLSKPVLAGHSIAGQELSSIGTRHPEKLSGLIYLDAAYAYAYYDPNGEKSVWVAAASIQRDIQNLIGAGSQETRMRIKDIQAMLSNLQQGLEVYYLAANGPQEYAAQRSAAKQQQVYDALFLSARKYPSVKDPTLAIFAQPHACQPNCEAPATKAFEDQFAAQANAFEAGNQSARVLRLPFANHYLFRSNEAEVEQEMNSFMDALPKP